MRSELQLAVLRFYRDAYKFARSKPEPLRSTLVDYLKREFTVAKSISRLKFNTVVFA